MMRAVAKSSIYLAAMGVAVLFVVCHSALSEEPQKANTRIKELQQKRLTILEESCTIARHLYQQARGPYTEVGETQRELLAARLAYAVTKKDRIEACDEAIKNAREWKEIATVQKEGARGTALAVLRAADFELEAQIARENAEAGK